MREGYVGLMGFLRKSCESKIVSGVQPSLYFTSQAGAGKPAHEHDTVMKTEGENHRDSLGWPGIEESSRQVSTVQRCYLN